MAVVKMHQAADGSLHKTARLCADKNIELRLAPAVEKFVDSLTGKEAYFGEDAESGLPIVRGESLASFVLSNATALRKILNDALITPKPRKKEPGERKIKPVKPVTPVVPKSEEKPLVANEHGGSDPLDDVLADLN